MAVAGIRLTEGSTVHDFQWVPTGNGGRGYTVAPRSIEAAPIQWRKQLHPFDGGLNIDRLRQSRTYAKGNCDASNKGELLPPPLLNTLTFTNATTPTKCIEFDGQLFVNGGRYIYTVSTAYAVAEDKDLGASKAAVDMAVFNNELIVAMGESEKIWKRSLGQNTSGTANAAVTTTDTTLTDTRLALTVNAYIGATVTCDTKTLVVTSNTATTFTGSAWSGGGNPGDGDAWSVAGTWTQATDNTYAIALGVVDNKLWRAETTNRLSNCITTPLTLTNWSPTSTNRYTVGDSTWAVHTIRDYGGVVWAFKGDGAYQADPATRFHNQTPQARDYPHVDNCKGAFVAQGFLWVPTISRLLQVSLGVSRSRGPELTYRPDFRFWVRGGVEWGDAIYLLCTDESAVENTFVCKMMRDPTAPEGHDYVYHEFARAGATTKGYFITAWGKATNPAIVFGLGNDGRYFKLGRGGGRDIDDANYAFGLASVLETGAFLPGESMEVPASLVGVSVVTKLNTNDTLAIAAAFDEQSYTDLLNTQEGGGSASITVTTNWQKITRYATAATQGQFLKVRFTGVIGSGSAGTTRPSIREAWAFGYLHPAQADVISVAILADQNVRVAGIRRHGYQDMIQLFRRWKDQGTWLTGVIPEYETDYTTRFIVTNWQESEVGAKPGPGAKSQRTSVLMVELTRIDIGGQYAHA